MAYISIDHEDKLPQTHQVTIHNFSLIGGVVGGTEWESNKSDIMIDGAIMQLGRELMNPRAITTVESP